MPLVEVDSDTRHYIKIQHPNDNGTIQDYMNTNWDDLLRKIQWLCKSVQNKII